MDSFRLEAAWLPSRDLVIALDPNFVFPDGYVGLSTIPHIVELFMGLDENKRSRLVVVDESQPLGELYKSLADFYAPEVNIALFYTYATVKGSPDVNVLVNVLYLGYHYGVATGPLLNTIRALQQSPLAAIDVFPTREQIDKFLSTKTWFANESLHVPADFVWEVSQRWTEEKIVKVLTLENGVIARISKYATTGLSPEQIEAQIVGTGDGVLPASWLDAIMEGIETGEVSEKFDEDEDSL